MAKVLKKQWIEIKAPDTFKAESVGESYAPSAEDLVGRTVKVNLMNLTNDPKTQNVRIGFKVFKTENEEALTRVHSYDVSSSHIKRMVRRGATRIDDSFVCKTKDNSFVRLKPFLLTRFPVSDAVASNLRKTAKEFLTKKAKKSSYKDFASSIVNYKLQRSMRNHLKKVYPLKSCEVRSMKQLSEEQVEEIKKEKEAEEKTQEAKKAKEEEKKPKKAETKKETKKSKEKKKETKDKKSKKTKEKKTDKEESKEDKKSDSKGKEK